MDSAQPIRVLVADPPWLTPRGSQHHLAPGGIHASVKYPCMSLDELAKFHLPGLAKDAVLFMWRLSSFQEAALILCHEWGFTPKCELVWRKKTTNDKVHFGMGMTVHSSHETCIIAKRGSPKQKVRNVRSIFDADEQSMFDAPKGAHSAKPDLFYDIVESMYGGPYHELFARRSRPGWVCEGNEL